MKIPRRGKKALFGAVVMAVLATIIFVQSAQAVPATTVCASGCDYDTIQAAVTAASPNDVITVAAGTYTEDVSVNKALTISGVQAGADARTRSGSETVVQSLTISANNVVLDGLSLSKVGTQLTVASPAAPTILSGVVVRDTILDGYSNVGIVPDRAGNIILQRLRFKNPAAGSEPMQFHSNGVAGGCTGAQVLDSQFDLAANNGSANINFSCTGSASSHITVAGNVGNTNDPDGSSLVAFSGVADDINVTRNTATTTGSQVIFFDGMTGTATISYNNFPGGSSSGVAITGPGDVLDTGGLPSTGTFYVTNNDLSGNNRSVRVTANGLTASGKVVAYGNNLSGNATTGIANASPGTVSATNNWWGSSSGPGAGDIVGSNVTSAPPCSDVTCSVRTSTFEDSTAGSPNGQAGWQFNGTSDAAVVSGYAGAPAAFGSKSVRISNAVVTGGFADQLFSLSLGDEAGESTALNGGLSGGTRRNNFSATWQFASATPNTAQPGLAVTVSPDRGDGARMSFIRMRDETDGLAVDFVDVPGTSNPADFVPHTLASGLDRTAAHTVRMEMIFNSGPSNDLVLVWIDGVLVHIGTSWENYFRYDSESSAMSGHPGTVDSLIFRLNGTPKSAYAGKGFLVDNVTLGSQTLASTANLDSLSLSIDTLSPAFNPATMAYTASVANSVGSVTVTGTTSDGSVFGCGLSTTVALTVGNNAISCSVVSQDLSTVKMYTITVNRAAAYVPPPSPPETTPPPTTPPPPQPTPTTSPPVTAPPGNPTAPVVAPVRPGQSGSIQVTTPVTTAPSPGTGGGTPPPPKPVEVAWQGNTFGDKTVTVKVDPKPVLATTPTTAPDGGTTSTTVPVSEDDGGAPPTTVPPATQVGNGLTVSVNNTVMEIAATDDKGNPVTQLSAPMTITIPAGSVGEVPAYSRDGGKTWVTIPRLTSPTLPPGQSDGYFVNADGSVSIITLHLTYFGLLSDGQAPAKPVFGVILSRDTKTLRFVGSATDNVGVVKYVLAKGNTLIGVYNAPFSGIVLPRSDGNYVFAALDKAGNISRSDVVSVYGTTVVVDTKAPTVPRLTGRVNGKSLQLNWSASHDQTKVTYLVFRDGKFVAELSGTGIALPRQSGWYTVDAVDQVGHRNTSNGVKVVKRGRSFRIG